MLAPFALTARCLRIIKQGFGHSDLKFDSAVSP